MKAPPLSQSRAPSIILNVDETPTKELLRVLRMRVRIEGDKEAARALKITFSRKGAKHVPAKRD